MKAVGPGVGVVEGRKCSLYQEPMAVEKGDIISAVNAQMAAEE